MKSFGLTLRESGERRRCATDLAKQSRGLASGQILQRIQGFPYWDGSIRKIIYATDKNFLTISTRQFGADVCEPNQWLR